MSYPSSADVPTFAVAIVRKRFFNVIVSGSSSCISSEALNVNSFEPPPPGINPTLNSTRPVYVSAAGQHLSECKLNLYAPPIANPWDAFKNVTDDYLDR